MEVQGCNGLRSDFGPEGTGFGLLRNLNSLCGHSGRWRPAPGMRVPTHLDRRRGADAVDWNFLQIWFG